MFTSIKKIQSAAGKRVHQSLHNFCKNISSKPPSLRPENLKFKTLELASGAASVSSISHKKRCSLFAFNFDQGTYYPLSTKLVWQKQFRIIILRCMTQPCRRILQRKLGQMVGKIFPLVLILFITLLRDKIKHTSINA